MFVEYELEKVFKTSAINSQLNLIILNQNVWPGVITKVM